MEPGTYWVRTSHPICDGGGIIDEPMGDWEVARWDGLHWHVIDSFDLADQIDVEVGPLVAPPAPAVSLQPVPKDRHRLSKMSQLVLFTRPPGMKHAELSEAKAWKAAFDELVDVHDALLDEVSDLRELLGDAQGVLEQCRVGEYGHMVDVSEIRLVLLAMEKELE